MRERWRKADEKPLTSVKIAACALGAGRGATSKGREAPTTPVSSSSTHHHDVGYEITNIDSSGPAYL